MRNIMSSYRVNGLTARVHGNTHRLPKGTLSPDDNERIVVSKKAIVATIHFS